MLAYNVAMVGVAGLAVYGMNVAQSFGMTSEQINVMGWAVVALAAIIINREVTRMLALREELHGLLLKQVRLARVVGVEWNSEEQDYVKREPSGPATAYDGAKPSWETR